MGLPQEQTEHGSESHETRRRRSPVTRLAGLALAGFGIATAVATHNQQGIETGLTFIGLGALMNIPDPKM